MIFIDEEDEVVEFVFETPRLSSFDLKYSFKAPFPWPRALLGDEQDDDDEKEPASEDGGPSTKGAQVPDEGSGLDMTIHTGIAGQLRPVSTKYTLTMDDGTEERVAVRIANGSCGMISRMC